MPLTGVQIYKLLPKTNCKECGFPTCLAFAMNLAAGKTELSQCPYVGEEAKAQLAAESAPPIRTVQIGTSGDKAVKVGGETVLFRHEKTFYNKTALALLISDTEAEARVEEKIKKFQQLKYIRVGLTLNCDLIACKHESGDEAKFASLVEKVAKLDAPVILVCFNPETMKKGLELLKDTRPLIYAADEHNWEKMAQLAKEYKAPLAVRAGGIEDVAKITEKLSSQGINDIVIDSGARKVRKLLEDQVTIRRLSIQKKYRPVGFPTITFPCEMTDDPITETAIASTMIAKYASIVVLSDIEGHTIFPLLLERLNIFTDPQRPMKTDAGLYEFNSPTPNSPVLVTSNFSLTYFIVSGEIENSRQPAYLLVLDTDGLSVLTGWAAGKFSGDAVAALVKKSGVEEKIKKKNLVLPGLVASTLGDVEEELGPAWNVIVGPREASVIPSFLKQNFPS